MEKDELEEIMNKESDVILKRCRTIIGQENLQFKDAFNRVYGDLNLHQYRHYASPSEISPGYLLPFFEQVVVPHRALNERSFEKVFGMNVEDLVSLIKKGRVVLNITDSYVHYSNLDFFDPVLELMPPSNLREIFLM